MVTVLCVYCCVVRSVVADLGFSLTFLQHLYIA